MRVINTRNSLGDAIQLTKEEYLDRWEHASLQDVTNMALISRHYRTEICSELKAMQDRLDEIKHKLVESEFDQKSIEL